ncbi:hypothetical protein [uncultured Desulfosarcina sp.]|uniref:hypothetical protein n=1 Tax=uncultured Desulfosarcina sp. TaxID=218289 RepID=UPI0029C88F26|nr:hypothetical protein [uncultured Desulfosarcina sp.]
MLYLGKLTLHYQPGWKPRTMPADMIVDTVKVVALFGIWAQAVNGDAGRHEIQQMVAAINNTPSRLGKSVGGRY